MSFQAWDTVCRLMFTGWGAVREREWGDQGYGWSTSLRQIVKVLVAQRHLTLCDPMDCRLPGSSVHGILQARILEWVAIPFSRWSFSSPGSNPSRLHCRQILYCLSHQGSPNLTLFNKNKFSLSLLFFEGLSWPTAWGIFVSQSGIEPVFPALEGRFLTTGPQLRVPQFSF